MSNNFRKTPVLKKKKKIVNQSYTAKDFITNKFCGPLLCLNFTRPLLSIFHIFVCNFSREILVERKRNFYRQMYSKFEKVILALVAAANALDFFQ